MIECECIFVATTECFFFATQCDGDKLVLSNLELSQEQAIGLAGLVNSGVGKKIQVELKVVE